MTKRYIEELNKEELTSVFQDNVKLQEQVQEDMIESEMHWVGEKLDYVRKHLSDWAIGAYSHSYIIPNTDPSGLEGFLEGLKNMQQEVPAFSDEQEEAIIPPFEEALNAFMDCPFDEDNYDELEELAIYKAKEAAEAFTKQLTSDLEYTYKAEAQLDYFLSFYVESRMDEEQTYYVLDEDEEFTLYQDIVKAYNN